MPLHSGSSGCGHAEAPHPLLILQQGRVTEDVSVRRDPLGEGARVQTPAGPLPDKVPIGGSVLTNKAGAEGSSGDLTNNDASHLGGAHRGRGKPGGLEWRRSGWSGDGDDDWDIEVSRPPRQLWLKYDPLAATQNRDVYRVPAKHRGKSAINDLRRPNVEHVQAFKSGDDVGSMVGPPPPPRRGRRRQ